MPSTCTFSFNRQNPVYYSGETIVGIISLHTNSEKNIRGAYILFEGVAKVRWSESRSRTVNGKTQSYSIQYSGTEYYLNQRTCVFGEGKLPAGVHEYTFNIPLPLECPTSCTQEYGSISYEISLKLDRAYRFDNVFTQRLTVLKELNLNHCPTLFVPVMAEDIKYFCCWPCTSGPVISTLTIPFGGWAPGQEIPYKLEIDNLSTRYDLDGTKLKLMQTYHFTARSPDFKTRTHSNCLTRLEQEDCTVLPLTKRIFEGKLRVPPVPPSSIGVGIVKVFYHIEMELNTGGCHKKSEIGMPIVIGTIPLAQSAANREHVIAIPPTAPTPTPTPDTPDSPDVPPSYDICMPPTFEEATHIGKKFKDTDKDEYHNKSIEDWLPQYPTYNDFAVPTAASAPQPYYIDGECIVMESRPLLNLSLNANITPSVRNGSRQSDMPSSSRNS